MVFDITPAYEIQECKECCLDTYYITEEEGDIYHVVIVYHVKLKKYNVYLVKLQTNKYLVLSTRDIDTLVHTLEPVNLSTAIKYDLKKKISKRNYYFKLEDYNGYDD